MPGIYQDPIEIIWQGIALSISYCPSWSASHKEAYGFDMAHIEVRCDDRPLPITDTGYRSHFIARPNVEKQGGVEAFVRKWLDESAKETGWTGQHQLALF
ncbi:MAG: hypothetical protein ACTS1Z_12125 [Parasphingopyxis sp.]|uniref:hypothetical protein n=1 Tax=Parasphingopyxis sp. TaxID=1920299 RepID=UPI003FA0E5FD